METKIITLANHSRPLTAESLPMKGLAMYGCDYSEAFEM